MHDEDVRTTNRFVESTVNLTVREFSDVRFSKADAQLFCDVLGEFGVTAARDEDQTALSE